MNINFTRALLGAMLMGLFACDNAPADKKEKAEAKRPNIVFIMSDDHAFNAISTYGSEINTTPNIDRLAAEGARLDGAYVTNSICGPSRACLLTGKMNHKNGFLANYMCKFDNTQNTVQKAVKAAGYNTALIGKWHLGSDPTDFDYYKILPDQGDYYNPDFIEMDGDTVRESGYVTDLTTDMALEWMDENKGDKPFLMFIQHKAPHRNWMPNSHKLDMYAEGDFPLPYNFFMDFEGRGSARASKEADMSFAKTFSWGHDMKFTDDPSEYINYTPDGPWFSQKYKNELGRMNPEQRAAWAAYYEPINAKVKAALESGEMSEKEFTEWKYQRYMHDYLATVSSVDDNVGRVMDYLAENGLEENTIVVYTSDQSFYLGENGWFDKRFMYEQSHKMPFIIKYPKEIKAESEITDLVMNIDFAPTLLDYAGAEIDPEIQGRSFRKVVSGETPEDWRASVYYHYYQYPGTHSVKRHYGVRTDRYKLIHFYEDINEWELYDMDLDPMESNNLINNPEYAEVKAEMMEVLKQNEELYDINEDTARQLHQNVVDGNKK